MDRLSKIDVNMNDLNKEIVQFEDQVGELPDLIKKTQSTKDKNVYANWSKAEYQMHFRNAASNQGLLHEAREWWNEQPLEYRRKKEKQWEERYGKDWRKHVVL